MTTSKRDVDPMAKVGLVRPYKRGMAYVDGAFLPAAEASISIFDHSFLYGDGAFESIALRNLRLFKFQDHLDRLWDSCAYLQIEIPITRTELGKIVERIIGLNGVTTGDIRIVVSRGEGYPISNPANATRPYVIVSAQEKEPVSYPSSQGLRLIVASTRRVPPQCLDPRVKSNNYLNHIVAKLEALAAKVDDAIMLNIDGYVAELPGCNIFVCKHEELATPLADSTLSGITRAAVIRIAREGRCAAVRNVVERRMTPYDLYTADEVFVTGTGTGVAFVSEIDGRTIGDGTCGPVSECLGREYEKELNNPGSNEFEPVAIR
jgi:branched-chain amino acid aminotransferase